MSDTSWKYAVGALAAGLAFSSPVLAAEQVVSFAVDGQQVVGTLNLPDDVAQPPVVLLLHGFTGSRDELATPAVPDGIFAHTADVFAQNGLASLRIDFMGSGDSDGSYADTTLQIETADALAALDFLAARDDVDMSKASIVGWSMGGAVAAMTAARTDHPIASVSLWEAGANMYASMALFFGSEAVQKALTDPADTAHELALPWGGTISLKGSFFRSLAAVDPVADIVSYSGPLLVTSGTIDPVVYPQPESAQVFLDYHDGPEELWTRPMDHGFNAFQDAVTVDEMIEKTASFIAEASK
jgi:dienelactone hydrolase